MLEFFFGWFFIIVIIIIDFVIGLFLAFVLLMQMHAVFCYVNSFQIFSSTFYLMYVFTFFIRLFWILSLI
jgi:hypothetical protein